MKKGGAFTQACSVLIVETSARNYAQFLPFYEIKKCASGVLLDVIQFSTVVNFNKYRLAKNNLSFNEYTAIFKCESKLVDYTLYKTTEEIYSRISIQFDVGSVNCGNSIDKISNSSSEESSLIDNQESDDNDDITESSSEREQNKLMRVKILYILGFFALLPVTFL